MGFDDAKDKVVGKAKEAFGKVTGDKESEAEGKTQQASGAVKDKAEDVKDAAKGAVDGLKGGKED